MPQEDTANKDDTNNKELYERLGVRPVSQEVCSRRWKFMGQILRKDPENDCNVVIGWAPEGKCKHGLPKVTWRRNIENQRKALGHRTWVEARVADANKAKCRCSVEALCATRHQEER